MTHSEHLAVTLWLAREVARLHALTSSLMAVVEEIRVVDRRLDGIDALKVQKDAWQEFLTKMEDWKPGIAAMIDHREIEEL